MTFTTEPMLYCDPQAARPIGRCPLCGGELYPPTGTCTVCEREPL